MNRRELNGKSPNRHGKYVGDTRYEKVWEQMQLLGIEDITTKRQRNNSTVVWLLPVKDQYGGKIHVASFSSGYVRRVKAGGFCPSWQINKCKSVDRYFKHYEYNEDYSESKWSGRYNKYTCKERILIQIEIDRLEYLIIYCLKNYYIKRANEVANGEFVSKWEHEWQLKRQDKSQDNYNKAYNNGYAHGLEQGKDKCCEEVAAFKTESEAKILILEKELENRPALDNLSVTVNGERYKII